MGMIEHRVNSEGNIEFRRQQSVLKTGAPRDAAEKGAIQIFNGAAERIARAAALGLEHRQLYAAIDALPPTGDAA